MSLTRTFRTSFFFIKIVSEAISNRRAGWNYGICKRAVRWGEIFVYFMKKCEPGGQKVKSIIEAAR